jgi:hypothetical protein
MHVDRRPLRALPAQTPDVRHARVVDRFVLHGIPVDFRTLAARVVPENAKYLILDLDRTIHLGRNMGELLGWELCAHLAYGEAHMAKYAAHRGPGRFSLDSKSLRGSLRFMALGLQVWLLPGLFYLLWVKLAKLSETIRKLSFRRFGPEPVRSVQSVPQTALLFQLADVPLETVRTVMRRMWDRHAVDQVITREDLDWLRRERPGLRIVLTSASPEPVVQVAAEKLGIDLVDFTSVEHAGDRFATPFGPGWVTRRVTQPERIAPPSRVRINSSHAKIEGLLRHFPELADPEMVSVGITDTGYGEDHCWSEWLTRVCDLNSDSPFSPIVGTASPLREVHSAHVLTRSEIARRAAGEAGYLDPRRSPAPPGVDRTLDGPSLEAALGDVLVSIEREAERFARADGLIASTRGSVDERARSVQSSIEELCTRYTSAESTVRTAMIEELDAFATRIAEMTRAIAKMERPLSDAAYALTRQRERSRRKLDLLLTAR